MIGPAILLIGVTSLKLDFVREEVAWFYGVKGNVSEDPVAIMKMMHPLRQRVKGKIKHGQDSVILGNDERSARPADKLRTP